MSETIFKLWTIAEADRLFAPSFHSAFHLAHEEMVGIG